MFKKRNRKENLVLQEDVTQDLINPLPIKPKKHSGSNMTLLSKPDLTSSSSQLVGQTDSLPEDLTHNSESDLPIKKPRVTFSNDSDPEDSRDKLRKNIEISKKIKTGELPENVYRGMNSYPIYAEKSDANITASKYTGSIGQIKQSSHIKVSCRFDYAYGICKDWKEKGFCGFGDNCIFIHDRSDYKTGWELEKEWRDENRRLQRGVQEQEENYEIQSEESQDDKCGICGDEPEEPVVTECGHMFCYRCALEKYAKSSKCFVCNKDNKGIFNEKH